MSVFCAYEDLCFHWTDTITLPILLLVVVEDSITPIDQGDRTFNMILLIFRATVFLDRIFSRLNFAQLDVDLSGLYRYVLKLYAVILHIEHCLNGVKATDTRNIAYRTLMHCAGNLSIKRIERISGHNIFSLDTSTHVAETIFHTHLAITHNRDTQHPYMYGVPVQQQKADNNKMFHGW
ncbi:hypothetical protein ACJX0J_022797, partial [Zea mays]